MKNPFRKPSTTDIAQRELDDATRELLLAQTALDYAASRVQFNKDRIGRLKQIIKDAQPQEPSFNTTFQGEHE